MAVDYSKAVKCAIFCQEVYQDFSNIVFSGLASQPVLINEPKTDTQGAILPEGNGITIVFRGSTSDFDWQTNFATRQERADFDQKIIQQQIVALRDQIYPFEETSQSDALMHRGFIDAYFAVRDQIHEYIRTNGVTNVTATGHSLGGALATLCAIDVQYNFSNTVAVEMYTFGSPKVGNEGFRESFNRRVPNSYRFIYGMDIVPELPRWWQGYHHVDTEFRIGPRFSLRFLSQRFRDHAIASYIDLLKVEATKK
jgi:predicted lipase